MKSVLTTAIPDPTFPGAKPEAWYARHRPCVYCKAEVLRRRETTAGPLIEVQHHPRCDALKRG